MWTIGIHLFPASIWKVNLANYEFRLVVGYGDVMILRPWCANKSRIFGDMCKIDWNNLKISYSIISIKRQLKDVFLCNQFFYSINNTA